MRKMIKIRLVTRDKITREFSIILTQTWFTIEVSIRDSVNIYFASYVR